MGSTQPTTQKAIHTFQSQSVHNFLSKLVINSIFSRTSLFRLVLQKASVKKDYKALVLLKLRYFYHRSVLAAKKVPEDTTLHRKKRNCTKLNSKVLGSPSGLPA